MLTKKFVLILSTALLLTACGSSVKLDDVPVEDRSATSASQPSSTVAGVGAQSDLDKLKAGPVGVARVVYFDYDSYVIKPEFQQALQAHAAHLRTNKSLKAMLEGHTDERGGREYNLALGQKRAEAVRRAMGLLGVADAQMEAVSFGKEKPAAQGSDEAAWSKNRRVEISYR